jgi:hypothetical protein
MGENGLMEQDWNDRSNLSNGSERCENIVQPVKFKIIKNKIKLYYFFNKICHILHRNFLSKQRLLSK